MYHHSMYLYTYYTMAIVYIPSLYCSCCSLSAPSTLTST